MFPGTASERARSLGMQRLIRKPPKTLPPRKRWRIRRETDEDEDEAAIVVGGGADEKQTGESTT
jgi:hypothetical protein